MKTFKEVVKGIKKSEKYVDEVLNAARLQRYERPKMSDRRFEQIMELISYTLFGIGFLTFIFMCLWFFTTAIG